MADWSDSDWSSDLSPNQSLPAPLSLPTAEPQDSPEASGALEGLEAEQQGQAAVGEAPDAPPQPAAGGASSLPPTCAAPGPSPAEEPLTRQGSSGGGSPSSSSTGPAAAADDPHSLLALPAANALTAEVPQPQQADFQGASLPAEADAGAGVGDLEQGDAGTEQQQQQQRSQAAAAGSGPPPPATEEPSSAAAACEPGAAIAAVEQAACGVLPTAQGSAASGVAAVLELCEAHGAVLTAAGAGPLVACSALSSLPDTAGNPAESAAAPDSAAPSSRPSADQQPDAAAVGEHEPPEPQPDPLPQAGVTAVVTIAARDQKPQQQEAQLELVQASLPPMVTYPVQRLQAALGSGLTNMRVRLQTAVEREIALRMETELAAVEQEALVQARAFAEAEATAERTARLAAERELALLAAEAEDARQDWEDQLAEGQHQLRAARSAVRALEKRVAALQAELAAEQARREAAERQAAERQVQLLDLTQQHEQREQEWAAREREQERQAQHRAAAGASAAAAPPAAACTDVQQRQVEACHASQSAASSSSAGAASEAVLMHHMFQLQQEVATLKAAASQQPQAPQPASPAAHACAAQPATATLGSAGAPAGSRAWQGWVDAAPSPSQVPLPQHLPSLGRQQAVPGQESGRGPTRPASARQLLDEVRTWLHHQHQQQAVQGWQQEDEHSLLERMLQEAQSPSSPTRPPPGWQQEGLQSEQWQYQQQQSVAVSSPRRPLHEPRAPCVASPASGSKRRQTAPRPPSRWDYRPAWNEGARPFRVDDLPAAAAASARRGGASADGTVPSHAPASGTWAAQAGAPAAGPAMAGHYGLPAPPAFQPPPQPPASWTQGCMQPAPLLLPPQHVAYAPMQQAAPQPAMSGSQAFLFSPAAGAVAAGGFAQCFAGSPPPPAALASPQQPWQQQQQQQQWFAAGPPAMSQAPVSDPLSRPATAGLGLGGGAMPQQWQFPAAPPPPQQPVAAHPWLQVPGSHGEGWNGQQQQQQQQRPQTPGAALRYEGASTGREAWPPQPATAATTTPRPRSASRQDRPLAVAPTQVDEAALAAARAEYRLERDRIRAKRLRDMQESTELRLQ